MIYATVLAERPNIILFIADDISVDDLGCYDHPSIKTPHIDELSQTGIRFTQAYLTTSSCTPSRCSIISGRYPHNTGAPELHSKLPADQVRFPQLLKEAGYYTLLSGKNHMGNVSDAFTKISSGKGPGKEGNWVHLLQNRPKDQPFFMWLASSDAHKRFRINDDAPTYTPEEVVIPPYMWDAPDIRQEMTGYYHEVSRFDHYVGEVIRELKDQGVFENTLIIVMADNGRPFARAKTRLYNSGIQTPFVVHFPEMIKKAGVTESLVSSIDISATILDVAEVEKDERIQGQSFTPTLKDPHATIRDVIFAEHNWHVYQTHERMVRYGDYLYIKNNYPDQRLWCPEASYPELDAAHKSGQLNDAQLNVFRETCPPEELYQVSKDLHQLNNLAENPEYKDVLEKLRQLLIQWTLDTGDTVPDDPTPDRGAKGTLRRNPHREFPGTASDAQLQNHPGPIYID